MKRRFFIVFLIIFLLSIGIVSADTSTSTGPIITLSGTGRNVPAAVIAQLVQDYPNAGAIHITKWSPAEQNTTDVANTNDFVPSPWILSVSSLSTSTLNTDVTLDDKHIISCAKGVTKTLTTTFNHTISSSVSLSTSIGNDLLPIATAFQLGVDNSENVTISTTVVYNGPPEESEYNSREFRVRWYGDTGIWTGSVHSRLNYSITETIAGTWTMPVGSTEYAVDRFITPP